VDSAGNLFIGDEGNFRIRKITPAGVITTVAGDGTPSYSGDGGWAISAQIRSTMAMAIDPAGNLYFSDTGNDRVRKVTPEGIITTVARNAPRGGCLSWPDQLRLPSGIAVDSAGNLYVADKNGPRIHKITPSGVISLYAGTSPVVDCTNMPLIFPTGLALDSAENLYVADTANNQISKVSPDGIVTKIAAKAREDYSGKNQFYPTYGSIAVDSAQNIYIADDCIRKIAPNGDVTIVAGTGKRGYSGDGGPAASAQLCNPMGIAVDAAGNVYIADTGNNRIRKVTSAGIITTVAGGGK
jgi:sugar lactone lactonase YvrE